MFDSLCGDWGVGNEWVISDTTLQLGKVPSIPLMWQSVFIAEVVPLVIISCSIPKSWKSSTAFISWGPDMLRASHNLLQCLCRSVSSISCSLVRSKRNPNMGHRLPRQTLMNCCRTKTENWSCGPAKLNWHKPHYKIFVNHRYLSSSLTLDFTIILSAHVPILLLMKSARLCHSVGVGYADASCCPPHLWECW